MEPNDHGQYIDPRLLDPDHADPVPIPAAHAPHAPHAPYHAPKYGPMPVDLDGWPPRAERPDSGRRDSEQLDIVGPFEWVAEPGMESDANGPWAAAAAGRPNALVDPPHPGPPYEVAPACRQCFPLGSDSPVADEPWTHLHLLTPPPSESSHGWSLPELSSPATDRLTVDSFSPASPADLHSRAGHPSFNNHGSWRRSWSRELGAENEPEQGDLLGWNVFGCNGPGPGLPPGFASAPGLLSCQLGSAACLYAPDHAGGSQQRMPMQDANAWQNDGFPPLADYGMELPSSHPEPALDAGDPGHRACDCPGHRACDWQPPWNLEDVQPSMPDPRLPFGASWTRWTSPLANGQAGQIPPPPGHVPVTRDSRNYTRAVPSTTPRHGDGTVPNGAKRHSPEVSSLPIRSQPRGSPDALVALPHKPASQPLVVIQYTGKGGAEHLRSPHRPARTGIRTKPLTDVQRASAGEKRASKNVCVRCKLHKVKCVGDLPCERCLRAAVMNQPCVKAHFLDIVESGTLNYISQRAINHITLDGTHRVQKFLPDEFCLPDIMAKLERHRGSFDVCAHNQLGSLYVLDLDNCFRFLSQFGNSASAERRELRNFIDNTLVEVGDWERCVRECDPREDTLSLLSLWNNMPSRFTYTIVSKDPAHPSRPLDIQSDADVPTIFLAAQLSRIVCRKLEIDGYAKLQQRLHDLGSSDDGASATRFVRELGRILLTLRWRMSWWELLGDGSATPDPFRDRYVERVRLLCRTLYIYYFAALRKVQSFMDEGGREALRGVVSTYADAKPVFDDFPRDVRGFEAWLEGGKDLVRRGEVERRLKAHRALGG